MALDNQTWSQALVAELYTAGVRHFCVAPGSRSAPLALAVFDAAAATETIRLHTHFDERGLGFFALNLAKVAQQPVVVITTSGTAVANLHPAVIEAWESEVPLLVFSADRPEELHNCGANQAITQHAIFGENVFLSANLQCPTASDELVQQRQLIQQCCAATAPSQINCQFAEPLYPAEVAQLRAPVGTIQYDPETSLKALQQALQYSSRTLVIVGALTRQQAQRLEAWLECASALVFTDINSQLKCAPLVGKVHYYDLCLLNKAFIAQLKPDLVLQFGGRLVSKRLNQWLSSQQCDYWLLNCSAKNLDPSGRAQRLKLPLAQLSEALVATNVRWLGREKLLAYDKLYHTALADTLQEQWSEAQVCVALAHRLQEADALFIGNSLAIRLFDSWLPVLKSQPAIFSNRGASGIDGLLASCAALAEGSFRQVFAVLGDTSLLHDLNSLALLARAPLAVKVIVLNNNGGRIFELLPAAKQAAFESLFVMPHGLNFEASAAQFRLPYFRAVMSSELPQALDSLVTCERSAILECSIEDNRGISHIHALITRLKCLHPPNHT